MSEKSRFRGHDTTWRHKSKGSHIHLRSVGLFFWAAILLRVLGFFPPNFGILDSYRRAQIAFFQSRHEASSSTLTPPHHFFCCWHSRKWTTSGLRGENEDVNWEVLTLCRDPRSRIPQTRLSRGCSSPKKSRNSRGTMTDPTRSKCRRWKLCPNRLSCENREGDPARWW